MAATPKKASKSRLESFAAREEAGETVSHLAMPHLPGMLGYLVDLLFRVGPASNGEQLSFLEIGAWSEMAGHPLEGWEAEALRTLSAAWVSEYRAADDPSRAPPYTAPQPVVSREAVADARERIWDRMIAQDQRPSGPAAEAPPSGRPARRGSPGRGGSLPG